MNYPANTHQWKPGDVVIHDKDAKQEEMLMEVLGYDHHTGECKTRYLQPRPGQKYYYNEIRYLHDPTLFGLKKKMSPREAAKQLITENSADGKVLRIGVSGNYDGYHVQIGGSVVHPDVHPYVIYDRHLALVTGDGNLHFFNVHQLAYELNPIERTPREAAKNLLHEYVRRGVRDDRNVAYITHGILESQCGSCGCEYWVQIGEPKRHQILVKDVNRIPVNMFFDVRELVKELHAELTLGKQQSLWEEIEA